MNRFTELATYWTQGSLDRYGNPTWNGPNTTKVRWEDRSELFISTDGKRETSRSRVYMEPNLDIGDYITRGENSDSESPSEADVVKQFQEVRNVRGDKRERKVIL